MTVLERVKIRKKDADETLLLELELTVKERVMLRYQLTAWPEALDTIAVEVVTALYNRHEINHEGVDSESVDTFSIKFINDILDLYDRDIKGYLSSIQDEETKSRMGVVRFI